MPVTASLTGALESYQWLWEPGAGSRGSAGTVARKFTNGLVVQEWCASIPPVVQRRHICTLSRTSPIDDPSLDPDQSV
jgi:hypothetical protein